MGAQCAGTSVVPTRYLSTAQADVMTVPQPLAQIADFARRTQASGFSGLLFTESGRTAYLDAAVASQDAPGLELSTGVAVAFPRSPFVTAATAWELQEATNGKFRLGLGTQVRTHVMRTAYGRGDAAGRNLPRKEPQRCRRSDRWRTRHRPRVIQDSRHNVVVFQRNSSYLSSEKPNTVTLKFVCEKRTEPSARPGGRSPRFCIALRDLHVCVRVGVIREGVHT
jgi:Luciferase-like monooxygenase